MNSARATSLSAEDTTSKIVWSARDFASGEAVVGSGRAARQANAIAL